MGTGTPESAAADKIPAALADTCANVGPAGSSDTIAGCQARFVAAPGSVLEAADVLRAASELRLTVVVRGSGSRQHWGAPPTSCDLIIDTRGLHRVLEHAVGDLVVTAQAGVRVDDLTRKLALAGQRLALDSTVVGQHDPVHRRAPTVGGLIATGAAGPLRYRYGSPRDLLIGITVVRADGTIAKSGGKVVKNVAGYDLGKLFAGSYGTLGLIADATFRLHPKPETSTWITIDCGGPEQAADVVRVMGDAPLAPSSIELSWPSAAEPISVSVLLEGDQSSVDGRADRMASLLSRWTVGLPSDQTKRSVGSSAHPPLGPDAPEESSSDRPHDLAAAGVEPTVDPFRLDRAWVDDRGRTATVIRVAFWAGHLDHALRVIRASGAEHGIDPAIGGSAGAGVLEVSVDHDAAPNAVGGFVNALRAGLGGMSVVGGVVPSVASAVVVCAPAEVRDAVDLWGPVPSLRLMRAVKDQFDPEHRLAGGI
jgi:glycolate oxidase FAD binding subunit